MSYEDIYAELQGIKALLIQQNQTPKGYIDTNKACAHLDISRITLWRLVKSNEIPTHKIGGQIRFTYAELDAYAQRYSNHNGRDNRKVKSHE